MPVCIWYLQNPYCMSYNEVKKRTVIAMADMRRTIKDSVFTYLFRQPAYTLELYRTLHPEDTDTTEADLKLITLENILSTGIYPVYPIL